MLAFGEIGRTQSNVREKARIQKIANFKGDSIMANEFGTNTKPIVENAPKLGTHLQTVGEGQAAEITGFTVRTLQQRRWLGKPPAYLKVGRLVRYRVSDLEQFLDSCTVEAARG